MISRRSGITLFAVVLVTLHTSAAPGADGPAIGVLLWRGTGEVDLGTQDRPLILEGPTTTHSLPAGRATLILEEAEARIGALRIARKPFRLRAAAAAPTRVLDSLYEGWIEVLPVGGKSWKLVNRLPVERYLLGVVPREMPESFEPAALRAQAIACRTYAVYQILSRATDASHHVKGDTSSQVYGGVNTSARVRRAVEGTRGQVLIYDGKVFEAFFHSTCGGATFGGFEAFGAPDIQPLAGVTCGYCRPSTYWRWQNLKVSAGSVRDALQPVCQKHRIDLGAITSIEAVERGSGGHAAFVRVGHDRGSFEMDATLFRLRMIRAGHNLRSTAFRSERHGEEFVFHGQGWGHGVGMCQMGVQGLAGEGYDAVGILQFYYRGSRVVELWR